MITALVLAGVVGMAQVPVDEPDRLRTLLPNGAGILVERMSASPMVSVQLFAGTKGIEETTKTNGLRHLLEHLVARSDGTLDARLEAEGCFLRPRTLRDASVFEVQAPTGKLRLAFEALREIVAPRAFSQAEIDREARIMAEEAALREGSSLFSEAAWKQAFEDQGGDPFGDLEVIRTAKPEDLERVRKAMFAAPNVALSIAGDLDLDAATAQARGFLERLSPIAVPAAKPRRPAAAGRTWAAGSGEALAVPVPGYRDPDAAAVLSAALALASELSDSYVIYTPSAQFGMVILGSKSADLGSAVASGRADQLFGSAKLLGKAWVARQLDGASNVAFWRGLLLVQARDLKPETLAENIDSMTLKQFEIGLASFRSARAVHVVGR